MILLTHHSSTLLGVAPEDYRCGTDGLVAVHQNQLQVKASPEKWLPWNYPTPGSASETENNDAELYVA